MLWIVLREFAPPEIEVEVRLMREKTHQKLHTTIIFL